MRQFFLVLILCYFCISTTSLAQDNCDIQSDIATVLENCAVSDYTEIYTATDNSLSFYYPEGWIVIPVDATVYYLVSSAPLVEKIQQGAFDTLTDGDGFILLQLTSLFSGEFEDEVNHIIGRIRKESTSLGMIDDELVNGRRHISFSVEAYVNTSGRVGFVDFTDDESNPAFLQLLGLANSNSSDMIALATDVVRQSFQYPPTSTEPHIEVSIETESEILAELPSYSSVMNIHKINPRLNNTLSPDGKWIAWEYDGELCLYGLADEQQTCSTLPETIGEHVAWLKWSPNSQYIAFHEDFMRTPDADVWLFHVADGTLENLTDDGDAKFSYVGTMEFETWIDSAITWGSDNQIYAMRTAIKAGATRDESTYELLRIDPETGDVAVLQDLTGYFGFNPIIYRERYSLDGVMSLSPDLSQMAVLIYEYGTDAITNGIWLIDLSGKGEPQHIATLDQFTSGYNSDVFSIEVDTRLIESITWGIDGDRIYAYATTRPLFAFPMIYELNVDTGDVTPLLDFSPYTEEKFYKSSQISMSPAYYVPYAPVISPDGRGIIMGNKAMNGGGVSMILLDALDNDPIIMYQGYDMKVESDNTAFVAVDGTLLLNGNLLQPDQ